MTALSLARNSTKQHPLDVIERLVSDNDWISDRRNDQEMAVQVPGRWCDYSLFFAWNDDAGAIHFTCAFDMRVPEERRTLIYGLLALINEKMWLGHFGLWDEEGLPMFRHALPLRGSSGPSLAQMEDLVETAIVECERFYPAFQYAIWGGKTAAEAVAAAMIDTVGEA
ncbi:MAG: YbjN domain-containing protein [Rhodospirillaceae bacterium]|nr:YbjN domain-containing protein [Rhodospirillaceae bacterium]